MEDMRMSTAVMDRIENAASQLGVASPRPWVGNLIERSFTLPYGDKTYGQNALTPGTVPFEPSFSEREPGALRFTISPLGPGSSPTARRDEATREMRRLTFGRFGRDAVRWFDEHSEDWRGMAGGSQLTFGGWLGSAYDQDGLAATKAYYELSPGQIAALPLPLRRVVEVALMLTPGLRPVFMSLACRPGEGAQRVTFEHRGPMRLRDLEPLMAAIGLQPALPGLMQIVGIALGGRFTLPADSTLIGIGAGRDGLEMKLEVLLSRIPDLPPEFMDLLALGLAERPGQLRALNRWLQAFTPAGSRRPGEFSVLSAHAAPRAAPQVSLYLRPFDFQFRDTTEAPR
jgi:hypothetical protein